MKILVTGGAGFIGSHLVEELLDKSKQYEITILDDFSAGREQNIASLLSEGTISFIKSDIRSIEAVEDACKGIDLIFHLAAKTNVDESLKYPLLHHDVNARGTLNLLKSAVKNNSKFVQIGAFIQYGSALQYPMDESHPQNPQSPYAASKVTAEKYVYSFQVSYKVPTVILRIVNNFGPRQKGGVSWGGLISRNVIRALSGYPIILRGGNQTRDYLYVKDTVRAISAAAFNDKAIGEVFNIGSSEEYSASDIAMMIKKLTNSDVEIKGEESRVGDIEQMICDYRKASKMLDWSPQFKFEDGLLTTIKWYGEHLGEYN